MPTHSTPAGVVREYFETLRWLAQQALLSEDAAQSRRLAALTTIQAVAAVEVFLNLWFQTIAAERKIEKLEEALKTDLINRASLEKKLATWPARHLGCKLDLQSGPGLAFCEMKELRNSIVHFYSSHHTVHFPQIIIHGLADTSRYDGLLAADAKRALGVAEDFVIEIFRLAGFDAITTKRAGTTWIAKADTDDLNTFELAPWLVPHVER